MFAVCHFWLAAACSCLILLFYLCVLIQVEELRRDLRIKSQELEAKNAAANDKLKKMVKDQQEAEKKKVYRKSWKFTQPIKYALFLISDLLLMLCSDPFRFSVHNLIN